MQGILVISALLIWSNIPRSIESTSLVAVQYETAKGERPGLLSSGPRASQAVRNNQVVARIRTATEQGVNTTAPSVGISQMVRLQASENEFVVVIDCGSSGSRVQIYSWPRDTPKSLLASRLQTLRNPDTHRPLSLAIRPGLSSVRDEPERASDYLVPLLEFASKQVPRDQHRSTPVYVMGTAGLRSLTINERSQILNDVMRDSTSEFDFELIEPSVISGSEEGFFQWLSVNLLAKRLNAHFNQIQGIAFHLQPADSRRFGLIEMGGVSAQVTFEVTPTMDRLIRSRLSGPAREVFERLRLETQVNYSENGDNDDDNNGRAKRPGTDEGMPTTTSSIFAISFLGFGSDSARSLAVDLLIRDAMKRLAVSRSGRFDGSLLPLIVPPNATLVLEDPCLPRNSEDETTRAIQVLYSPTRTIGYDRARRGEPSVRVRLVGRSNYGQCRALVERMLAVAWREQTTCLQLDEHSVCDSPLIGSAFVPWRHLQFLGMGDLFYTTDLLGLSGPLSSVALLQRMVPLCSRTSQQLDQLYGAESEFERQRNKLACFKANWILVWLTRVLKMPPAGDSVYLTTLGRIQGDDVDWKLGAVLAQTVGYRREWAR